MTLLTETGTIDLFADDANRAPRLIAAAAARAKAEPEPAAPPALVAHENPALDRSYTAFWKRYHAAVTAACEAITVAGVSAQHLWSQSKGIGSTPDLNDLLATARAEVVRDIRERASREFSPPRVKLDIDEDLYGDLVKTPLDKFDPDAIWLLLERTYGGDKGQSLGLKQTAQRLADALSLRYSQPTHLKGRMDVKVQTWSELRFNGKRELTYQTCNKVYEALVALQGFCEWAGDLETQHAIQTHMRANRGYSIDVPEHRIFGAISFKTRISSTTWTFTGAIAEKFQAFISEFGQEALASRD